jgi:hypothetical protein
MVDITIAGDRAIFRVEGVHKLVDREQVGVWWHGFKLIGTDVPGLFAAGTFYYHGELVFWDVVHPERTIIVSLVHERYTKLIVEVENPESSAVTLREAKAGRMPDPHSTTRPGR